MTLVAGRSNPPTMTDPRDTRFMTRALELAHAAAEAGEAPIGALVVDPATDEIIAEAHNGPIAGDDPTAHAEILALRAAAAKRGNYRLTGLELYVTLEPCTMCCGALVHARVGAVIFAAREPRAGAVVSTASLLDNPAMNHRVVWNEGLLGDESAMLLRQFFQLRRGAAAGEAAD